MKRKTKAWFGNQYYDPKKKRWIDGKKPKQISLGHNSWFWNVIFFILVSLAITAILSYFFPGTKFAIFFW